MSLVLKYTSEMGTVKLREGTWKSGIDQAFTRQAHCLDEILELTIIIMMGSFAPRLIKSHPA